MAGTPVVPRGCPNISLSLKNLHSTDNQTTESFSTCATLVVISHQVFNLSIFSN